MDTARCQRDTFTDDDLLDLLSWTVTRSGWDGPRASIGWANSPRECPIARWYRDTHDDVWGADHHVEVFPTRVLVPTRLHSRRGAAAFPVVREVGLGALQPLLLALNGTWPTQVEIPAGAWQAMVAAVLAYPALSAGTARHRLSAALAAAHAWRHVGAESREEVA